MRYVILGLILCVAVFVGHRPVAAELLRIVYTAISLMYGPLWVTQQAGLFKKYNLDVELLYLSGGSRRNHRPHCPDAGCPRMADRSALALPRR